jgi:hypothetical protein
MMTDFDKLIRSGSEDQTELALNKGIRTLLDQQLRQELDKEVKSHLHQASPSSPAVVRKLFPIKWLSIAASFVVLAIATFWWLNQAPSVSPQQYAMADAIKHPGLTKGQESPDAKRAEAITAFNAQNWQAAATAWSAADLNAEESRYYLALSYFYAGSYANANTQFATLTSANSVYSQEVKWFYGLSLILNGEKDRGNALLATIKKDEWHYNEAQSLLTK